ncbi:MAG: chemotaxis protein CheX [Desulfobaccales bacterium]
MLAKLRAATFEVLETMFFLFPESLEEGDILRSRGPFLRSSVAIAGPQSIRIGLQVPESLARKMAANFLGTGEDQISQLEMEDILKETANMLAGSFLSKLEASAAFKLQTPIVQVFSAEEQKRSKLEKSLRFDVEDELLELFVEKG